MPESKKVHWCLITPEYPPTLGGVADYTRLVAMKLVEAGEQVTVLAPSRDSPPIDPGLSVEPVMGEFGLRGFWRGSRALGKISPPRRIFLQWVPHGYGFKSMNLLLVVWLWWRVVVRRDQLWIMAHEPFLAFENSLKQKIAACVHRAMVWTLLRLADRAFAGNRLWIKVLNPWCPKRLEVEWLPVPSNLPVADDGEAVRKLREKVAGPDGLVGHFGTYGAHTEGFLAEPLRLVLEKMPGVNALLLGKNGDIFRKEFVQSFPHLEKRVTAPGVQAHRELSVGLSACDVMLQAYTGGISTRNTSIMSVLSHGKPSVGTKGHVTDSEWDEWGVVDLFTKEADREMASKVCELMADAPTRLAVGQKAWALYEKYFIPQRMVEKLLVPKQNTPA